jgi:hypothetical protein
MGLEWGLEHEGMDFFKDVGLHDLDALIFGGIGAEEVEGLIEVEDMLFGFDGADGEDVDKLLVVVKTNGALCNGIKIGLC